MRGSCTGQIKACNGAVGRYRFLTLEVSSSPARNTGSADLYINNWGLKMTPSRPGYELEL